MLARLVPGRQVLTRAVAIGGGKGFPADPAALAKWLKDAASITGLPVARMDILLTRYGITATQIVAQGEGLRLPDSDSYSII